ncbi:hypothetical protein RHMOL_Rhmol13G0118000 [Rhododendron molle]|uniref:Uncharacterized protein n=1 Tax=Rhododendron molle TaxID=49168 RepID=A0ACC0L5P2_RHOML|nr:hypothetical protein RHMOL_Rhmol13G0118000 [Rhododendron molle]
MAHNDVMEVSGENGDGPWTTRNEKIFIQLMDEEVKSKKSRETGTFTGEAWKRIRSELIRLTGYSYTKEQVKNKYNVLSILFNKFNSLKSNSGVGWDSTLLTVTAPDDVWERLFKSLCFNPEGRFEEVELYAKKVEMLPLKTRLVAALGLGTRPNHHYPNRHPEEDKVHYRGGIG